MLPNFFLNTGLLFFRIKTAILLPNAPPGVLKNRSLPEKKFSSPENFIFGACKKTCTYL